METGQELPKRNNELAHIFNKTPINSTALGQKASKLQKVIKKRVAARQATKKTCGNLTGAFCVLKLIQSSEEGADPRTLKKMTGFNKQKVHRILYKLFKHGEIRIESGGNYTGIREKRVEHNAQSLPQC